MTLGRCGYLVETNPTPDDKKVRDFVTELNERLPALKCKGGNWVPDRG